MTVNHANRSVGEDAERTPLLSTSDGQAASAASAAEPKTTRRSWHKRATSIASLASISAIPQPQDPNTIVAIMCILIFISCCQNGFFMIPMTRILEDRFCQEYYSGIVGLATATGQQQPIDEELCKVDVVQSRLAYMFAATSSLEAALGCLLAMPWGFVADRIGQRSIFAVALTGLAMTSLWQMAVGWFSNTLPIQLYLLGPLGMLIGGGSVVLRAVIYSIVANILPEGDRAVGFMRIHVASMLGNLCSPAMASFLMPRVGPWPLLWASVTLTMVPAFGGLLLPPMLDSKSSAVASGLERDGTLRTRFLSSLAQLKDSLGMLKSRSVVLLMLTSATLLPVIESTLQFMCQFTSKRYHIRLADTGYIQFAYGAAHVLVILIVIPLMTKLAARPTSPQWLHMPDQKQRDLVFLRLSFAALILGSLVLGFSLVLPAFLCGLFVLAFGSGAGSYVSSTLTFLVDKEHRTRMYSLVGIAEVVGALFGSPMLAGLFSVGMKLGGIWIGLPYLGVGALCGISIVMLTFVRFPVTAHEDGHEAS